MRVISLLIAVLPLFGCDASSSSEDAKLKTALVGPWYFEYKDTDESVVKGVLNNSEIGTFTLRKKIFSVENPPEEKSSGTGHVTAGLFKLLTSEVDGKKLAPMDSLYFTCKVTGVSGSEFSCRDEVAKQNYSYKRAAIDFKLS